MRRLIFILCMAMTIVANAQDKKNPTEVMLETTAGNIRLRLYDSTPLHRDNFVKLVNLHVYDSLLFHRVIKDFMIQCGDPKSKNAQPGQFLGEGDLDWTVEQELRLPQIYHRRGVLAPAREPGDANPYPASRACHFYLSWAQQFTAEDFAKLQQRPATIDGH